MTAEMVDRPRGLPESLSELLGYDSRVVDFIESQPGLGRVGSPARSTSRAIVRAWTP
jgi:hypothetical protein